MYAHGQKIGKSNDSTGKKKTKVSKQNRPKVSYM